MRTEKAPGHATRLLNREIVAGVLVIALSALSMPAFASGSSPSPSAAAVENPASRPPSVGAARVLSLPAVAQSVPAAVVYAADCTTPQTTFHLGDTVCVSVEGLNGFRLQWVDPDGFAVNVTSITADPQSETFVLPSTGQSAIGGFFTANNLGRWRVNAITSRNSVKSSVFFTVKDPNNPKADLSIVKSTVGSAIPNAGDPIQFAVTIVNQGPDDAVNTRFVDNTFSNLIFNSVTQTGGPQFSCSGGTCQIASFPNGATATFVLDFTAGPAGGLIENTASVSSDTPELNQLDNSTSAAPVKVGSTGPAPTCDLTVTAPSSVTLFTGPGATSCSVVITDLDARLGVATATDSCPVTVDVVRGGVPAGGNFPVGTTTVTYTATDALENTAAALQNVTVVDNTPPTIACPPSITLEPTCPAGAIGAWTAPVAADNCSVATTAQTGGPASGSVFPIGTTSVAYTVSDAAGNQASCAFTVTVLTVNATMNALTTRVESSTLTGPQKQGLLPKLDAALAAINRGDAKAACNTLSTFVKAVEDDVAHGYISASQGQAWTSSALNVSNAVGCTNNPCR